MAIQTAFKNYKKMMKLCLLVLCLVSKVTLAQNFTSYFTGSANDKKTNPSGGVCLMGGATENDEAMKWFLKRCNGGDVLVLRTAGTDGYNSYMFSDLGITLNSVETIVLKNAMASREAYVIKKIKQAEAIWFAGGDQWQYVSYWRNSPVDSLVNEAIAQRNIVIGGTSAGMAIMGKYYFSAQYGTVTTNAALANPYNNLVIVDSAKFIQNKFLQQVITDTHYDNPSRKGRHMAFMARILKDWNIQAKGIACDEFTAVCIDTSGVANVFGNYPSSDDNAYFIQVNCENTNSIPENCTSGNPLNWSKNQNALIVCQIKGTSSGNSYFNLNNWKTSSGGNWLNWHVINGIFYETPASLPICLSTSFHSNSPFEKVKVYPNPVVNSRLIVENPEPQNCFISIFQIGGNRIYNRPFDVSSKMEIDVSGFNKGVYILQLQSNKNISRYKVILL